MIQCWNFRILVAKWKISKIDQTNTLLPKPFQMNVSAIEHFYAVKTLRGLDTEAQRVHRSTDNARIIFRILNKPLNLTDR